MHEEIRMLISAIGELKPETNYFKDYFFPIVSAFFTSLLGAAIAYFTIRWQEGIQMEKEKMNIANKWILIAEDARSNLLAIKGNYHGRLNDNPFYRLGRIPSIFADNRPIVEAYQDLSFIVPLEKTDDEDYPKWSQITRVRAMISNYNLAILLWKERTVLNEEFKEKLIAFYGNGVVNSVSFDQVLTAVGQPFLIKFIDLTERVVKLTDDLVVELGDFLENFPKYAKTKIRCKRLKRYGSVLTHSDNNNQDLLLMLKKSPEADFSGFEELFGESNENIKKGMKLDTHNWFLVSE